MGQESPDYRSVFHSMESGFCIVQLLCDADPRPVDYVFLDANAAFEQLTGIQRAKGRRMREIAPAPEEPWLDMYRHIAATGESRRFDYPSREGDRWYDGYACRVGPAEQQTIMMTLNDMTERKHQERALAQQVAVRTQELAHSQEQVRAMATELTLAEQHERKRLATELHEDLAERLLLARIKLAEIHQRGSLDVPTEELLKEADKLLTRALAYTHTVMADLSPLVLQDLGFPAALKWLAQRMQQHGLAVMLQTSVPSDLALPEAQAVFLFQAVRELLMNVLKHAKSRGATVLMTMAAGQLQIEVQDEGVGFEGEPADTSTKPSHLGLHGIRERMTALGGTFEIDSRQEKGTKATLKLPLGHVAVKEGDQAEHSAPDVPAAKKPGIPSGIIRVLLVDDHAMVRQGLKSVLDAYPDIKVVGEAADGDAAFLLASELSPTVVLMDINMPSCNGIEATQRITAQHPDIKVIGLSVDADGQNQEAMLKAGAFSLMTKEAAVDQLYSLIYEAVKPGVIPFSPLRSTS